MTSIAESEFSAGSDLTLRDADPVSATPSAQLSQRFNLRAYIAGGAATTALVAGAIFVFASLAAYVAFNGLPVGAGDENASQLTVAAQQSRAPEAAALAVGRATSAVAATAATAGATAPAPGSTQHQATNDNGGSTQVSPGAQPSDPAATGTSPAAPTAPATEQASSGPVSSAVNNASNATNLPLDDAAGGAAQQADDVLNGVPGLGNTQTGQQIGGAVNGAVDGATQGVGNLLTP